MVNLSGKVVVVIRLLVNWDKWGKRGLVLWHHVLGRSLLSVEALDTFMLLVSVGCKLLSNFFLISFDLSVNLSINVPVDISNDLLISDLSGFDDWHWDRLRDWWKWWRVEDRLLLLWDMNWGSIHWHHWSWLHFDNWHL